MASPSLTSAASPDGRRAVLLVAACVAIFLGHAWLFRAYVNDDAYITFRYSRFLAEGRGPYFNDGERVEGYTNFSLMLLVSGVIRVWGAGAAAPFARGLGVLAGATAVLLTWTLARQLAVRSGLPAIGVAGTAAGLLAVAPAFAVNSTSGLETTLYAAFLAGGVWLGDRQRTEGRWRGSGLCFAASYLTRPEGAAVFAVHWAAQAVVLGRAWRAGVLRSPVRGLVLDGTIVTAVFVMHVLFRYLTYDGEWLPNTYYAKIGGFAGVSPWDYFQWGALHPVFGWAGVVVAVVGLGLRPASLRAAAPLGVAAVFGVTEPFWAATDWMPGWRLIAPYLPLAFVTVAIGWASAWHEVRRRAPWLPAALLLLAVPFAWAHQGTTRHALREEISLRARGYETGHRALVSWLQGGVADPGDQIALMDIGIVGFACPELRILDVTGLTDRHIAHSPGAFLAKRYDPEYVLDQRPRFVVIALGVPGEAYTTPTGPLKFEPWSHSEQILVSSPRFRAEYVRRRAPPWRGDWLEDFAAQIGAVRVFEHAHPGSRYLLAVFETTSPEPAGGPEGAIASPGS